MIPRLSRPARDRGGKHRRRAGGNGLASERCPTGDPKRAKILPAAPIFRGEAPI